MPPSRMAEYFKDRRWRIRTEANGPASVEQEPVDGEDDLPPIAVKFRHGWFTVEAPGAFRSPLSGNPGRKGVLLQEVDADGNDIPGSLYPFGVPVLKAAREEFHAIV